MRGKQWIWTLILTFVASIAVAVSSILYAGYIDRQSNQRWCKLLAITATAYRTAPPANDFAKRFASEIAKLQADFECPNGDQ